MSTHTPTPWRDHQSNWHPLPWRQLREGDVIDANGQFVEWTALTNERLGHIVRACNSHDELVAALKEISREFEIKNLNDFHFRENAKIIADNALAKAEAAQ